MKAILEENGKTIAPLALMKEWEYPEVGVKNSYLLYHEELESLIRNIKGLTQNSLFYDFWRELFNAYEMPRKCRAFTR